MINYFQSGVCLIVTVISCQLLVTTLVDGRSYSSVFTSKKESNPVTNKTSPSPINLPAVPEFPRIISRPGKNPSPSILNSTQASAPVKNRPHNINVNSQPQQQQELQVPEPPGKHQPAQQQVQSPIQVPTINFLTPPAIPLPASFGHFEEDLEVDVDEDEVIPSESVKDKLSMLNMQHLSNFTNTVQDPDPIIQIQDDTKGKVLQQSQSHNETVTTWSKDPMVFPEKAQYHDSIPTDFAMPLHVMHILNALGSGGSLAQASKPEKEGSGHGFTTANAVGYATGDNATVNAAVSNKMELNSQTVILTESASASASSSANGTAFSQATLQSNGYTNNMGGGMGGGWPGSGWFQ